MNTDEPTEQYCIVMVSPKYFSSKVDIAVDFGHDTSVYSNQATEAEIIKKITSLVDALNYMAQKGWQLVNGYSVDSSKTGINEQHYLMKKVGR